MANAKKIINPCTSEKRLGMHLASSQSEVLAGIGTPHFFLFSSFWWEHSFPIYWRSHGERHYLLKNMLFAVQPWALAMSNKPKYKSIVHIILAIWCLPLSIPNTPWACWGECFAHYPTLDKLHYPQLSCRVISYFATWTMDQSGGDNYVNHRSFSRSYKHVAWSNWDACILR